MIVRAPSASLQRRFLDLFLEHGTIWLAAKASPALCANDFVYRYTNLSRNPQFCEELARCAYDFVQEQAWEAHRIQPVGPDARHVSLVMNAQYYAGGTSDASVILLESMLRRPSRLVESTSACALQRRRVAGVVSLLDLTSGSTECLHELSLLKAPYGAIATSAQLAEVVRANYGESFFVDEGIVRSTNPRFVDPR